ncbi:unnamed protein product [Chironomus riparius]|uniref:Rho-GAP domain-containing protein n=1 Tax=Chironomus riparius TaxID=315576 RepID=A0A9N9WSZ3_9DIPT|nr:unnamed protein product [Chironomus riparius]
MEDSSSPDEHEFPGLYEKNRKNPPEENESNSSENFEKQKKSAKKDKKDKSDKKDRQSYEALGADSEDDNESGGSKLFRSPSKSKKSKTFKFPSAKKTEKREKSVEIKEVIEVKDKKSKEKHKDHKDDKKKDKKDKKEKCKGGSSIDVAFEIGDIQPIFGVSLGLAVERSRCHDGVKIPLVVRNCIDVIQENLQSEQVYKVEGVKARIQHLKKCYNNRDTYNEELDVPTASSLLKAYLQELPEPILTTELITRFEEASALPDVTEQAKELEQLIDQLPKCNQILLAWLMKHFSAVISTESNKLNAQSLAVLLSPILQLSHRLMITLLCHAETLFADVLLQKYVPPIHASTSPNLPETVEDIQLELRKQESLLNQIHSEMNAGFVTKKREEELWETQRIITQLKRKLRTFEKKQDSMQKSMDTDAIEEAIDFTLRRPDDDDQSKRETMTTSDPIVSSDEHKENDTIQTNESSIGETIYIAENGLYMLPKEHPDYHTLIRLQLENQELMSWKQQLQTRISAERAECVKLKRMLETQPQVANNVEHQTSLTADDPEFDRIVEHYIKENALLEQKRILLGREIVEENLALIQLQVDLAMKQIIH